jgi:hypothetical protein
MKMLDITGAKFNKLTAIKVHHKTSYGHYFWEFICDCGKTKVADSAHVKKGNTKSCGCIGKNFKSTHGMSHTKFNHVYWGMRTRCENSNATSHCNYGGRGIKCLWGTFEDFRDDMYETYIKHIDNFGVKNTLLDRIDNDGDYTSDNCKWSTRLEQNNNRRKRRWWKKPAHK